MTPFEEFFAQVFQPALERLGAYDSGVVFSNGHGIQDASWDRKAAFLLWMFTQGMDAP